MPNRDCAAVHVYLCLIQSQFALARDGLCGKGLVDFDAIDLLQPQSCVPEHGFYRRHRANTHDFRRHSNRRTANYSRQWPFVRLAHESAGGYQSCRGAIYDAGAVSAGLYAIKHRGQFGQNLDRGGPYVTIFLK